MDVADSAMDIPAPSISPVENAHSQRPDFLSGLPNPSIEPSRDFEARIRLEERDRIARDIHDSTSQLLVLLQLQLVRLKQSSGGNSDVREITRDLEKTVSEIHQELRMIGGTKAFDPRNFSESLRSMAADFAARAGCNVTTLIAPVPVGLPDEVAEALFRVAQEALANATHHAQAGHIGLAVSSHDRSIRLQVVDDGVGFEGPSSSSSGRGIPNMSSRLRQVGGDLIIRNCNPGTMIEATVSFD